MKTKEPTRAAIGYAAAGQTQFFKRQRVCYCTNLTTTLKYSHTILSKLKIIAQQDFMKWAKPDGPRACCSHKQTG